MASSDSNVDTLHDILDIIWDMHDEVNAQQGFDEIKHVAELLQDSEVREEVADRIATEAPDYSILVKDILKYGKVPTSYMKVPPGEDQIPLRDLVADIRKRVNAKREENPPKQPRKPKPKKDLPKSNQPEQSKNKPMTYKEFASHTKRLTDKTSAFKECIQSGNADCKDQDKELVDYIKTYKNVSIPPKLHDKRDNAIKRAEKIHQQELDKRTLADIKAVQQQFRKCIKESRSCEDHKTKLNAFLAAKKNYQPSTKALLKSFTTHIRVSEKLLSSAIGLLERAKHAVPQPAAQDNNTAAVATTKSINSHINSINHIFDTLRTKVAVSLHKGLQGLREHQKTTKLNDRSQQLLRTLIEKGTSVHKMISGLTRVQSLQEIRTPATKPPAAKPKKKQPSKTKANVPGHFISTCEDLYQVITNMSSTPTTLLDMARASYEPLKEVVSWDRKLSKVGWDTSDRETIYDVYNTVSADVWDHVFEAYTTGEVPEDSAERTQIVHNLVQALRTVRHRLGLMPSWDSRYHLYVAMFAYEQAVDEDEVQAALESGASPTIDTQDFDGLVEEWENYVPNLEGLDEAVREFVQEEQHNAVEDNDDKDRSLWVDNVTYHNITSTDGVMQHIAEHAVETNTINDVTPSVLESYVVYEDHHDVYDDYSVYLTYCVANLQTQRSSATTDKSEALLKKAELKEATRMGQKAQGSHRERHLQSSIERMQSIADKECEKLKQQCQSKGGKYCDRYREMCATEADMDDGDSTDSDDALYWNSTDDSSGAAAVPLDDIIGAKGVSDDFGLYKYQFLDKRARALVRKHEHSSRQVVLAVPRSTQKKFSADDIKQHLRVRFPAKFDGFSKKQLDLQKLREVLGYSYQDAATLHRPPHLRYSIVGDAHVEDGGKKVYVIHTWGVNLESEDTEDGKYVYNNDFDFSFDRYKELLDIVSECIFKGVDWIKTKEKKVTLRVTQLGFGAWSNALPNTLSALKEYRTRLLKGAQKRKKWLTVLLADYPKNVTYDLSQSKSLDDLVVAEDNHDPFGDSRPSHGALCFVNAWDLQTFIGNGGSEDQSLDGWMVNGGSDHNRKGIHGKRLGHYFVNDSFLHNVFFNPGLLDEENWIL